MDKITNQDSNSVQKIDNDSMYKITFGGIIVISLLLIVIILQLFFMNKYLRNILEDNFILTNNNVNTELIVQTETTKSVYEVMPGWTEPEETQTTQPVTENNKSTSSTETGKNESTTQSGKTDSSVKNDEVGSPYVINTNTKKIHRPSCSVLANTKEENKKSVTLTDEELKEYLNGSYEFCKKCGG